MPTRIDVCFLTSSSWTGDPSDQQTVDACRHILSTLDGFNRAISLALYEEGDTENFIVFEDDDDGLSAGSCEGEHTAQETSLFSSVSPLPASSAPIK